MQRAGQLLLWALLLPLLGCSDGRPTRVPVSGRVLIDGKPLTLGSVMFVPKGDRPSSGTIDKDGRFTLTCFDKEDGAVVGTHRIAISAVEQVGPGAQKWHAPKKYVDYSKSGLTAEVTGPTNDVLIELSWDGGKPFIERGQGE
jgi:hypothetical protein